MSEETKPKEEPKQLEFTDVFKPPVVEKAENEVQEVQDTILSELAKTMSETQLWNIRKLAPLDEFEIPEGSGKKFKRQMIKPKQLRRIRKMQQEYGRDLAKLTDIDERLDREFEILQAKAEIYLGMSQEDFDNTDVEQLQQVLQATELRTNSFRRR